MITSIKEIRDNQKVIAKDIEGMKYKHDEWERHGLKVRKNV